MHVTDALRKLEEIIVQQTVVESVRVLKWSTTHRATKTMIPCYMQLPTLSVFWLQQ